MAVTESPPVATPVGAAARSLPGSTSAAGRGGGTQPVSVGGEAARGDGHGGVSSGAAGRAQARTDPVRRRSAQRWVARHGLRWVVRAVSLGVAIVAWQLLTANNVEMWLRFSKIPGPAETMSEFWVQLTEGDLMAHIEASTWRIAQGFGLAAVAGVILGAATGRSRWANDAIAPVLEVLRPIPAIAWVPMAILLFPTGEQGIVFITFLAALFPVVVSTRHAVRALPVVWEDAVRTMGGSRLAILWRVVLPGSLPGIFSGLSVSMGVAWICVISAEMISGQHGVGYYTWMSYSLIDYAAVIVGMMTIGFLGLLSAGLVEMVGRWATRWLPRAEAQS